MVTTQADEVFLTGSTGFVGSHVLSALLTAGFRVRALVRSTSQPRPQGSGYSLIRGDVRAPGELARAMDGCRYLVHVAAVYSFSPAARDDIVATNVRGCAGVLEASRVAGIERAVVTSSSATVGPAHDNIPATEDNWATDTHSNPTYHRSKLEQERVALAAQVPSVVLLPTAPVGPGDWKPTPTGKMIVDFMRGKIFASLDGGLNIVAVEDVARAHVAALLQGRPGERYLIGGENVSLTQLWATLARICGREAPTRRIPYSLALGLGWADEIRCRLFRARAPLVPLEGVRMAQKQMYVTDQKARSELGHVPTSATDALARGVQWYRDHGYAA
jgi:dihydroflavonol-4-reductase